jgi:predicted MFS family arabinose efflux permease
VGLTAIPVALVLLLRAGLPISPALTVVVVLGVFGFAFAVISSLHSYLILAYAGTKKAAEDVGFYYAANAAGRLLGILLSGALAQYGGLPACLWGSAAMLAACLALVLLLSAGLGTRRPQPVSAAE